MKVKVSTMEEIWDYRVKIIDSIKITIAKIEKYQGLSAIQLFLDMKFMKMGRHPLEDRNINFIEQLNQTFTYLASLAGAEILLQKHHEDIPFTLNLGAIGGYDIKSNSGMVLAETFTCTHVMSNNKIIDDREKLSQSDAKYRYLIFYSEENAEIEKYIIDGIDFIQLNMNQLLFGYTNDQIEGKVYDYK